MSRIDVDGNRYPMVGALPFEVSLDSKPRGHGYTVMETVLSNPYFSKGSLVKGHEFHRSRLRNLDHELVEFAFRVKGVMVLTKTQMALFIKMFSPLLPIFMP